MGLIQLIGSGLIAIIGCDSVLDLLNSVAQSVICPIKVSISATCGDELVFEVIAEVLAFRVVKSVNNGFDVVARIRRSRGGIIDQVKDISGCDVFPKIALRKSFHINACKFCRKCLLPRMGL